MLEIKDLQNLNEEQIIDLILEQKKQPLEIYVPKATQQFFSDNQLIATEYAELAYAGQLLKDISEEFSYEEVSPTDHQSVLFKIRVKNINKLAETLLHMSYGYVNENKDDEEFIYEECVNDYLDKIKNGELVAACPYFIKVYKELSDKN